MMSIKQYEDYRLSLFDVDFAPEPRQPEPVYPIVPDLQGFWSHDHGY